jgi:hypothetical protein
MDQKHDINKWKNKQYIEACSNGLDELQPRVLGILSNGNPGSYWNVVGWIENVYAELKEP